MIVDVLAWKCGAVRRPFSTDFLLFSFSPYPCLPISFPVKGVDPEIAFLY